MARGGSAFLHEMISGRGGGRRGKALAGGGGKCQDACVMKTLEISVHLLTCADARGILR